MSTVKGAGRASGVGAVGVGLGDGVAAVDGTVRATWAAGRAELGPSVAGSTAITSNTIRAGRMR
jgi:hypothetical protein